MRALLFSLLFASVCFAERDYMIVSESSGLVPVGTRIYRPDGCGSFRNGQYRLAVFEPYERVVTNKASDGTQSVSREPATDYAFYDGVNRYIPACPTQHLFACGSDWVLLSNQ